MEMIKGGAYMAKSEIERKIYYYDVVVKITDETNTLVTPPNQKTLFINSFNYINNIYKQIEGETDERTIRILLSKLKYETETGDIIYIIVDDIDEASGIKFRIVLCRTNALPFIEKSGKLTRITTEVNGDFNIAEITHCILFPDKGIMGAEFNFSGARPSTIIHYLPQVVRSIGQITCTGKIRSDIFERLADGITFSLFEIAVKNTQRIKTILRNNMGIIGAFFNETPDIDTYQVTIKRRKTSKKRGFEPPLSIDEMKTIVMNNREEIDYFRVSQGTYKDAIDLLSDKLVCTKEFILTIDKTIDTQEMYTEIFIFYNNIVKNA